MLRRVRLVTWFFAALWAAPVFSSGTPPLPVRTVNVTAASAAVHANPEAATGYAERELAYAQHFMVSAANPIAARAGADILAAGGQRG